MAEEDNLVIRMLREIRSQQVEDGRRLAKVERQVEDLHEGMITAMGMSGLARISTEKQGEHMDEIRDEIAALKRRVTELEARA